MNTRSALVACTAIVLAGAACQAFLVLEPADSTSVNASDTGVSQGGDGGHADGATIGDGGAVNSDGNAVSSDGGVFKPEGGCPIGRGPPMVIVHARDGLPGYCIDSTEVTLADYQSFMTAKAPVIPEGVTSQCEAKVSNTIQCPTDIRNDTSQTPVRCVDWCDAYAYCAWAGKRLCGNRFDGGALDWDDRNSVFSEWYSACSDAGGQLYPYGTFQVSNACNGGGSTGVEKVGRQTCEGSEPGVFDLVGNVGEWENCCMDPAAPATYCAVRGGSWETPSVGFTCEELEIPLRSNQSATHGIRCCSSL